MTFNYKRSRQLVMTALFFIIWSAVANAGSLAIELKADQKMVASFTLSLQVNTVVATSGSETELFNIKEMSWFNEKNRQWVTLAQCQEWSAKSKSKTLDYLKSAPTQMSDFLSWSLDPVFVVAKSNGVLLLISGQVDYVVEGETSKSDVDMYFRYAVLNAYKKAMTQNKLPPYAELKAIEEMKRLGHIPHKISITIPGVPGAPALDMELKQRERLGEPSSIVSREKSTPSLINREQVAATRTMYNLLVAESYEEFYRDWCHPHLQQQVSAKRFPLWMKSKDGQAIIRLYTDVIRAIDARSGTEVLVAQSQEQPDRYEFILRDRLSSPQWHLELQLHEGKWKLLDTD